MTGMTLRCWLIRPTMGAALSLLVLTACSGGPPRTPVPNDLVGAWYNGTVSDINFVDWSVGSWTSAGGTGNMYRFAPDGTYQYAWEVTSTLYGCTTQAMVFKQGTVAVDPASHSIQLFPVTSNMHSVDNCNAGGNYDRPLDTNPEMLIWDWSKDEYGHTYLDLRSPTSDFSAFSPMTS